MRTAVTVVFFLALVLLGVKIHGDYGPSLDDINQRYAGMVSAKYVLTCSPSCWRSAEPSPSTGWPADIPRLHSRSALAFMPGT